MCVGLTLYVCIMCREMSLEARGGVRSSDTGITGCEPSVMGPIEEEQVLLAIEPSLQHQALQFYEVPCVIVDLRA